MGLRLRSPSMVRWELPNVDPDQEAVGHPGEWWPHVGEHFVRDGVRYVCTDVLMDYDSGLLVIRGQLAP